MPRAAPPPLFPLFFLFFSLISRMSLFSLPFSPFFLSSSHRRTHTERERPRERERERESCAVKKKKKKKKEEEKTRVLESSVQSASTAPINDHPWSDGAEILQGGSQHVNLRCGRWRLDLEQSAVVFLHVISSSVLG
jgi:hypothetical protein